MAKRTETVEAKIEVSDGGTIKGTKKKVDDLGKSVEKTGDMTNKTKRNLEGLAQRSGSTGKDFSRMSQGMGGLVAAYATVAANVFALSTAFNVLKRSADFDSMVISANNLTQATGASFINMAQRVKEATGNQIQFEQALAATNKAVASGIDTANLEKFTDLATKAAQTFGGTTVDALNRMIDAVLRGRTELVNKMGIIVTADEAYEKYGASIGKAANELTSFEKRQAITNTIIEEGNKALGKTVIDPNPYEVLSVTFLDLGQDLLSWATATEGFLTTVVNLFNESKLAVGAFASIIVSSILKKAIPTTEALKGALEQAQAAQLKQLDRQEVMQTKHAGKIADIERGKTKRLQDESAKRLQILKNEAQQSTSQDITNLKGAPKTFTKFARGQILSTRDQSFLLKTIDNNVKGTTDSLTKLGLTKPFLEKVRTELKLMSGQSLNTRQSIEQFKRTAVDSLTIGLSKTRLGVENLKLSLKGLGTSFRVARLEAQELSFVQLFTTPLKGAEAGVISFGGKIGQVTGRAVSAFTKLFGAATQIGLVIGIAAIAWEFLKPIITDTNEEQIKFNDTLEEGGEAFREYLATIEESEKAFRSFAESGIKGASGELLFLANALQEASTAAREANKVLNQTKGLASEIASLKILRNNLVPDTDAYDKVVAKLERLQDKLKEVSGVDVSAGVIESLLNLNTVFDSIQISSGNLFDKKAVSEQLVNQLRSAIETTALETDYEKVFGPKLTQELSNAIANSDLEDLPEIIARVFAGKNEKAVKFLSRALVEGLNDPSLQNNIRRVAASYEQIDKTVTEISARVGQRNKAFGIPGDILQSYKDLDTVLDNVSTIEQGFSINLVTEDEALEDLKNTLSTLNEAYNIDVDLDTNSALEGARRLKSVLQEVKDGFEAFRQIPIVDAAIKLNDTLIKSAQSAGRLDTSFKNNIDTLENVNQLEQINIRAKIYKLGLEIKTQKARIATEKLSDAEVASITLANEARVKEQKILEDQLKLLQEKIAITKAEIKESQRLLNIKLQESNAEKELIKLRATRPTDSVVEGNTIRDLSKIKTLEIDIANAATKYAQKQDEVNKLKSDATTQERLAAIAQRDQLKNLIEKLKLEKEITEEIQNRGSEENSRRAMENGQLELAFANSATSVLRDNANKLNDSINILVKSFNTGINNVFQQLIKGEGSVKDALSALGDSVLNGLATTLSNALTENLMKSLFEGLMDDDPQKALMEANKANSNNIVAKTEESKLAIVAAINNLNSALIASQNLESSGLPNTGISGNDLDRYLSGQASADLSKNTEDLKDSIGAEDKNTSALGIMSEGLSTATAGIAALGGLVGESSAITKLAQAATVANTIATIANTVAQSTESGAGFFAAIFGAANGGVLGPSGPVPMANGGIATKTTPYIIGEGRKNEAVVPLPNNREIPVVMQGESGGDTIVNNYDFSNADPATETRIRNMIEANGKQTFGKVFNEMNRGGSYAKMAGRRR